MSFDLTLENGDIRIGGDGAFEKVFNETKLRQDLVKIIVTPLGTMPLFPWYGSPLAERTIGTAAGLDPKIRDAEMTNALSFAINNLQSLQLEQEKEQFISPAEAISQIKDVIVQQSPYDPRQFNVTVSVITRRANVVDETFNLRV